MVCEGMFRTVRHVVPEGAKHRPVSSHVVLDGHFDGVIISTAA
jgi:hypothetical protein